jgi:2-hydroxychromene-2-carboxylate isomerase
MSGVRFYFSFRSPYSWLAHHRLAHTAELAWEELEPVPVYPPDEKAMAALSPGRTKLGYMREDVERIAAGYGLAVRWPVSGDPDWTRPHAAFLYAQAERRGQVFAGALYDARFQRGEDLGDDGALRAAAEASGLDPDAVVAAADDPAWRQALWPGFERMRHDKVFGVPTFVLREERFWGNDRFEWLLRTLRTARGERVADLRADPWRPPQGD